LILFVASQKPQANLSPHLVHFDDKTKSPFWQNWTSIL
jgi:hypothetical protein